MDGYRPAAAFVDGFDIHNENDDFRRPFVPVRTPYADRRDPHLPWGYWLVSEGEGALVRDEDGGHWMSLRHALWSGRLCMDCLSRFMDEHLEILTVALSVASRRVGEDERVIAGDRIDQFHCSGHYVAWLRGQGLTVNYGWDAVYRRVNEDSREWLTDEGWAVLLMLKATRQPPLSEGA